MGVISFLNNDCLNIAGEIYNGATPSGIVDYNNMVDTASGMAKQVIPHSHGTRTLILQDAAWYDVTQQTLNGWSGWGQISTINLVGKLIPYLPLGNLLAGDLIEYGGHSFFELPNTVSAHFAPTICIGSSSNVLIKALAPFIPVGYHPSVTNYRYGNIDSTYVLTGNQNDVRIYGGYWTGSSVNLVIHGMNGNEVQTLLWAKVWRKL